MTSDFAPGIAHQVENEQPSPRQIHFSLDKPLRALVFRWTIVALLTAVAFGETGLRIVDEIQAGAGSAILLVTPLCAAVAGIGVARRTTGELPIHDRQTDVIVGLVLGVIASMLQWLVIPRYSSLYALVHVDVLAAVLFVLTCCVFIFGLRRTSRFWPVWIVLFGVSPLALRYVAASAGGGAVSQSVVLVILAALCVGFGSAHNIRRGIVATGVSISCGVTAIFLCSLFDDSAYSVMRQTVPPVVALATVTLFLKTPGWKDPWLRPNQVVSFRQVMKSLPILALAAVFLAVAPLPRPAAERTAVGPPGDVAQGMIIPDAWEEMSSNDETWAEGMFGPEASVHQQVIRSSEQRWDWDEKGRPRVAVVQTVNVHRAGVFEIFPVDLTLDLRDSRIGPRTTVQLGHNVSARFRTVIDEKNYLSWSLLTFIWTREDGTAQRVMVLTIDNHDFDAAFPKMVPGTSSTLMRLASVMLRGSSAVNTSESMDKDRGLLIELGRNLVEAQWTRR